MHGGTPMVRTGQVVFCSTFPPTPPVPRAVVTLCRLGRVGCHSGHICLVSRLTPAGVLSIGRITRCTFGGLQLTLQPAGVPACRTFGVHALPRGVPPCRPAWGPSRAPASLVDRVVAHARHWAALIA